MPARKRSVGAEGTSRCMGWCGRNPHAPCLSLTHHFRWYFWRRPPLLWSCSRTRSLCSEQDTSNEWNQQIRCSEQVRVHTPVTHNIRAN